MRAAVVAVITVLLVASGTRAAEAKAPYNVAIDWYDSTVVLGQKVTFTGEVSPAAGGKAVTLQRKYPGGEWKTVATKSLDEFSNYRFSYQPNRLSTQYYRVKKDAGNGRAGDYSPVMYVTVYRWRSLYSMSKSAVSGTTRLGGGTMDGGDYTPLYEQSPGGTMTISLRKKCIELSVVVGASDSSSDTSGTGVQLTTYDGVGGAALIANLAVYRDDPPRVIKRSGLGGAATLAMASPTGNPGNFSGFGEGRFLCSF